MICIKLRAPRLFNPDIVSSLLSQPDDVNFSLRVDAQNRGDGVLKGDFKLVMRGAPGAESCAEEDGMGESYL